MRGASHTSETDGAYGVLAFSMIVDPALKLGKNHGYLIDGDRATLNAEIAVVDTAFDRKRWALQLWACEQPHRGGRLSGTKVAEATITVPPSPGRPLPLMLRVDAHAHIPSRRRDYSMVLVLASGEPGAYESVHDFANYPRHERFAVPELHGTVGYAIEGASVRLEVERITNPRPPGNVSGSLSLELRALSEPLADGLQRRVPLAAIDLGQIAGQSSLEGLSVRTAFVAPPPGRWSLAMVLLEWTAIGFATRDSRTFAATFYSGPPLPRTPSHEEIALAAYYRYLVRGLPGFELHDWLEAERELSGGFERPAVLPLHGG